MESTVSLIFFLGHSQPVNPRVCYSRPVAATQKWKSLNSVNYYYDYCHWALVNMALPLIPPNHSPSLYGQSSEEQLKILNLELLAVELTIHSDCWSPKRAHTLANVQACSDLLLTCCFFQGCPVSFQTQCRWLFMRGALLSVVASISVYHFLVIVSGLCFTVVQEFCVPGLFLGCSEEHSMTSLEPFHLHLKHRFIY